MKVKFFGLLKDFAGVESVEVRLKEPVNANNLFETLSREVEWFGEFIKKVKQSDIDIIILVNDKIANSNSLIRDSDEVVLLPPAAGG